ncbi:MAG: hypothetical protein QOF38_4290 [Pseudonocardiales bacterium]|nr:hypothetical protein [Pseudonocardiales bacterium]
MTRDTPTAKDRAYRYTKDGVLDGRFPGGELISEGAVADALRMSRTPVREAFLLLEAEGLLRLFPKRGALVVPVSAHEIESVLEARELIEGHALRKILRRPDETRTVVTTQLREVLADQEARLATGDEHAFVDADRTFHQIIVTEAGNPILLELYQSLRDRQLRMGIGALVRDPDRGRRIMREHTALVEGLEAGDADRLDEHLRQHLDGTRTVLRRA